MTKLLLVKILGAALLASAGVAGYCSICGHWCPFAH